MPLIYSLTRPLHVGDIISALRFAEEELAPVAQEDESLLEELEEAMVLRSHT